VFVGSEPRLVTEPQRMSGYAIASLACGIAGFVVFPVAPSILAIIFGQKARREIREDPALTGDTLAFAGLVLGWVELALVLLVVMFLVSFVSHT
jgi:uncharacterized protein DUF4190